MRQKRQSRSEIGALAVSDEWDVGLIDLTARYGINDFETLTLQTSPTVRRESRY